MIETTEHKGPVVYVCDIEGTHEGIYEYEGAPCVH